MTIKGLGTFIKKFHPEMIFNLDPSLLTNKKVAIDAYGWFYSNYIKARSEFLTEDVILGRTTIDPILVRNKWMINLAFFIMYWSERKVIPLFVVDGTPFPEKDKIRAIRKKELEKVKLDITILREEYEKLKSSDILANCDHILKKLKSKVSNEQSINSEDFTIFENYIACTGLPCIKSIGDAEKLCALLCREGMVSAVYSKDIDTLSFGCPLLIKNIEKTEQKLECIRLDLFLEKLKLTYTEFVDLCILCGCDFNEYESIKTLGPKRAYGEILKYKRIENISLNYDYSNLNHIRCRELMYPTSSLLFIEKRIQPINPNPNYTIDGTDFFKLIPNCMEHNLSFFGHNNKIYDKLNFSIFSLTFFQNENVINELNVDIPEITELCEIKERIEIKKKTAVRKKSNKNNEPLNICSNEKLLNVVKKRSLIVK
jgi:flap endonuclease-1